MTALRIEIAGAGSFIISRKGCEVNIQTDKEFLLSMCKPHIDNVEFLSISKCDVCISDRFESDEEQGAVMSAFAEMWNIAANYSDTGIIDTEEFFVNEEDFDILCDHCRAFENWKESM